jgi:O-antigen ligase
MLNNIYNKTKIPVILIALIPIALLISSGISEFLSICIVIFYLIHLISKKNYFIFKDIYFKLLLLLWVYLMMNYLFSQNYNVDKVSFRSFGFVKYILLIFAFQFYLLKNKNFDLVFSFWALIVAIVGFDVFFEYFNHQNVLGFKSSDPARIASFLRTELKIGNYILGFSFLTVSYVLSKIKTKHTLFTFLCYLLLTILMIALYLTGERSNAIRGTFILIFFFIFGDNKILKHKYKVLISTIVFLTIVFFTSPKIQNRFVGQVLHPIKSHGALKTFQDSQYGAHYSTAILIFKNYPFFGIGNKNFRYECEKEKYFDPKYQYSKQRCSTHPHQIYLEFISEHGLFGTTIILYVIFFILYQNIKIYKKNKNIIHLSSILFVAQTFLPLIPSGSFFASWTATVFWLNFAIMLTFAKRKT